MNKELTGVIKGFIKRLEKTEKFVIDQAPDVCKEMIAKAKFDAKLDFTMCITSATFLISYALFASIHIYNLVERTSEQCMGFGISAALSLIFGLMLSTGTLESLKQLYYLKNCPKLFLLKEFKKLTK